MTLFINRECHGNLRDFTDQPNEKGHPIPGGHNFVD